MPLRSPGAPSDGRVPQFFDERARYQRAPVRAGLGFRELLAAEPGTARSGAVGNAPSVPSAPPTGSPAWSRTDHQCRDPAAYAPAHQDGDAPLPGPRLHRLQPRGRGHLRRWEWPWALRPHDGYPPRVPAWSTSKPAKPPPEFAPPEKPPTLAGVEPVSRPDLGMKFHRRRPYRQAVARVTAPRGGRYCARACRRAVAPWPGLAITCCRGGMA